MNAYRIRARQRGATLVEAALVFLLLFTLLIAIVEFARVFNIYQTITNAAREGARFGVAPCQSGDTAKQTCTNHGVAYDSGMYPYDSLIRTHVAEFMKASSIKVATNDISVNHFEKKLEGTANGNPFEKNYRYLRVQVQTSYDWLILPLPNLSLRANAEMKQELDVSN